MSETFVIETKKERRTLENDGWRLRYCLSDSMQRSAASKVSNLYVTVIRRILTDRGKWNSQDKAVSTVRRLRCQKETL